MSFLTVLYVNSCHSYTLDMVSRANLENIIHAVFCVIWTTALLFLLVWTDDQFYVCKLFRTPLPDFLLNLVTPLISLQSCTRHTGSQWIFEFDLKSLFSLTGVWMISLLICPHSATCDLWSQAENLVAVSCTLLQNQGYGSVASNLWNSLPQQLCSAD